MKELKSILNKHFLFNLKKFRNGTNFINYFGHILLLLTLQSCSQTFNLSEEAIKWNPYKKGDKLIFESNNFEKDTIFVQNVESTQGGSDHLSFFPNTNETFSVYGKKSLVKPYKSSIGDMVYNEHCNLIRLHASEYGNFIYLDFSKKEAMYYGETILDIDSLMSITPIKYNKYKDILLFENVEENYAHRDNNILTLYWRKQFGYIRYDLKDGYYWELKQFIRNGKNILN